MVDLPERPCRGCDALIPAALGVRRPREWCSGACRVATSRGGRRGPVPLVLTPCAACGTPFHASRNRRRTCSPACATQRIRAARGLGHRPVIPRPRPCASCPTSVVAPARRCAGCLAVAHQTYNQRRNAKRRGASPVGPALSVEALGRRDGWRCHLCRRKVNPALPYLHPRAGTRDHLIPISDGGDDSPTNLALAHRGCNSRRGARGAAQLLLIGG